MKTDNTITTVILFVGVDLFPIPAITGTNSIVGDITDEKTRGVSPISKLGTVIAYLC